MRPNLTYFVVKSLHVKIMHAHVLTTLDGNLSITITLVMRI